MEPKLTAEQERFMLWLESDQDVTGHLDGFTQEVPENWQADRAAAEALGESLRSHLPTSLEPPANFNEALLQRLARD